MSGLVGAVSEVYQGDRVDTVRGPAANKIEREIDLAKEILESEILVAQPPKKKERCTSKKEKVQNQKGGKVVKKSRVLPTKRPATKQAKKPVTKRRK